MARGSCSIVLALLAWGSASAQAPTPPEPSVLTPKAPRSAKVPAPGELNAYVLEVLRRYPTDGTHRYYWPRGADDSGWRGCTKDLEYAGEKLCDGDPEGRAYCCGLTFEVFLDAWQLWCERTRRPWRIADLSLSDVRRLQRQWFGSAEDRSCLRTALVENGLGEEVHDLEHARPGDFVQLWRTNGSGHSVVFLDRVWSEDGMTIAGLRYWSTQKATGGIGERVERFAADGKPGVKRDELYLCRVGTGSPIEAGRWVCKETTDPSTKADGVLELRKDGTFEIGFEISITTDTTLRGRVDASGRWSCPAGDLILRADRYAGEARPSTPELPVFLHGDVVHYVGPCLTLRFRRSGSAGPVEKRPSRSSAQKTSR